MIPETLHTGVREVDEQHANILREIRALAAGGEVDAALRAILAHFSEHFRAEEALMERTGYAHIWTHQREHLAFFDTMIHLRARWQRNGDAAERKAIVASLERWVKDHVLAHDAEMAAHLRSVLPQSDVQTALT